jgi:hypothetical protein
MPFLGKVIFSKYLLTRLFAFAIVYCARIYGLVQVRFGFLASADGLPGWEGRFDRGSIPLVSANVPKPKHAARA